MKMKYTLPKVGAILLLIIAIASCEEDFNTIGANIIGDENFNAGFVDTFAVKAYSRKLVPVQTTRLPVYQMGVYNDPTFGKSTVNFLAQLTLDRTDPSFEIAPRLDSVVLYMPFFSEAIDGDGDEDTTYELDSIYGNTEIDIKIFESEYFLRDFDPDTGFEELQNYYSNQGDLFESFLGELIYTIEDFKPSDQAIAINDSLSFIPGLRAKLPTEFFRKKIINADGSISLINNNNFRDYFRGLYFQVESDTDDGSLFFVDLEDSNLTLYYTFQSQTTVGNPVGGDTIERFNGELGLSFDAISVNTYKNDLPSDLSALLENPNTEEGEERLYMRGGDGIMTVVELFGDTDEKKIVNGELVNGENGVPDDLDQLRINEWIINEANLIFYVDKDAVEGGETEPERIIIYDLENSTLLIDYSFDITNNLLPVNAINEHLGPLERGSDGNGEFYKIKITNHLSNLINRDSTNVPLGVIVNHNVLENTFVDLESEQAPGIERLPVGSVVSPEGTVLHGNRSSNENKRLKLQIFYTEPE